MHIYIQYINTYNTLSTHAVHRICMLCKLVPYARLLLCACALCARVYAHVCANLQHLSGNCDPHLDHLQHGSLCVGVFQQCGQDHVEEDELQLHLTKGSNGAVQTGKIKIKYTHVTLCTHHWHKGRSSAVI